jgi:hypothetical protein
MEDKSQNVVRSESSIAYPYATIRMTQSRIDKGLIAIPMALAEWFPAQNETIEVYLNDSPVSQTKRYSSYASSTRECRIGGVREWFQQNNIKSGDEIVIQLIDKERFIYRLIPERNFILMTQELQHNFDESASEREALGTISTLTEWVHLDRSNVVLSEYFRLVNILPSEERPYIKKGVGRARESVPTNLRTLLKDIHKGHCQICDFWFLKRDREPYFEVHHLDPGRGRHPTNVLVVCGNCHNQFEHANVKQEFNDDKWLIRVSFNERVFQVRQVILPPKTEPFMKELFV